MQENLLLHMPVVALIENMVKKKPQSFVHCGYFDHHDLHSWNDYKFVFLIYQQKF
jgi:hypothetical protein